MTYIKAAMATLFALLILLVGYTNFTFDGEYSIQQAFENYLKGNHVKALKNLDGIYEDELSAHQLLYKAYVAREMGDFKASNEYLDQAVKETEYDTRINLRLEIYFNQALNGYLEKNFSYMEKAVQQMQQLLGNDTHEWADFFNLLYLNHTNPSELANNYEESNYYWEDVNSNIPLSPWMEKSFSEKFTPFWQVKNHIMYLINMDRLVEAGQLIETEIPKSTDAQKDELYLMMASSYIKEAKSNPSSDATPDYKLAYSYYSKISFQDERFNLQQTLEQELNDTIALGNVNQVQQAWRAMWILHPDNQDLQSQYKQILSDKIISLLTDNDGSRTQGFELLKFWNQVEQDSESRRQFSKELIQRTSTLRKSVGDGDHANQLLLISVQVAGADNEEYIFEFVKDNLKRSYEQLLATENYDTLPYLVKALTNLRMSDFTLATPEEIHGYLEEAQKAFVERDFDKANQLTNWVLTLSPNSKKALIIAGLVNYYQGHYKIAEKYLSKIEPDRPEILTALAVSQILSGVDEEEGMHSLKELERKGVLTNNVYLRLGFGEIVNNRPKKAVGWLGKLNQNNNEVKIGYALVAAEQGNWQEVLQKLSSLSPEFSRLDPIISLELMSYLNLGEEEKAEKTFDKLMNEKYVDNYSSYSQPFKLLAKKILSDYTRLYTASLYYEDIGNYTEALRYLDEIKHPSPTVLLRKGELLIDLKEYHDAKKQLLIALEMVRKTPESEDVEASILVNLALASEKQEQIIDTYLFYRDYFKIRPLSKVYRKKYVEALIKIRRYDRAYEQFRFMKEHNLFEPTDNLALIETKIHLDDFDGADQLAETWVSENRDIDFTTLLKLAQLMVITKNDDLINQILRRVSSVNNLSVSGLNELTRFYIYHGDFYQANTIINNKREFLEKTPEGLFGLAQFYLFSGELNIALSYAQKALEKDPHNMKIQRFIQKNRIDISSEKLVEKLNTEVNEVANYQVDYDSQFLLMESIIEKTVQEVVKNRGTNFYVISEFRSILDKLVKLSVDLSDIPVVQLYTGQLYYLLNNTDDASKHLNKAIDLDISYSKAYENLGLMYVSMTQLNVAKDQLIKAIHYMPYNSDAWFLLGKVNEVKEKLEKLAPDELEEVMAEIKSGTDFEPIKKLSYPY